MTKSKEVQVTASSKKDAVLPTSEGEDIETLKTQKRHKRNNKCIGEENPLQKNLHIFQKLPSTSEFCLDKEDKAQENLNRKVSHGRADSNKSANPSLSRPSSSTKKISKQVPLSTNMQLKRAIQKVKVSINPCSSTIKSNNSFSYLKSKKPTITNTSTATINTSILRTKIEANIEKEKNNNMDKISRKIASLIKQSGTMKVTKLPKKETQSSSSRDSISNTSHRRLTASLIKPTFNPSSSRISQTSTHQLMTKQMIRPILEEYKVVKTAKREKIGSVNTDQLVIDQKMTQSNYSCNSQVSASKEYLHKSRVKDQLGSRENPYINRTNKSSTSNSRVSSRGASISGPSKTQIASSVEKPASLKNLLKQIHNDCKDTWSKQDPISQKKTQQKPIAVPASPFVRMKPKNLAHCGLTISQKLK